MRKKEKGKEGNRTKDQGKGGRRSNVGRKFWRWRQEKGAQDR